MRITKEFIKELIIGLPEGELRDAAMARMMSQGDLTDADIAELSELAILRNTTKYQKLFREDEILQQIYARYQHTPDILARILVKLYPNIFLNEIFTKRLVIRMKAMLGYYFIPPKHPGTGGSWDLEPIPNLDALIAKDLFEFDVEHLMRTLMFIYSQDAEYANQALREDMAKASLYKKAVIETARKRFEELITMRFENVVTELTDENGERHPFPAIHVRYWIQLGQNIERVLNIGETCTYKTSHALVASQAYGLKRVLVICSANARRNYEREVNRYFVNATNCVQVLELMTDADEFLTQCAATQFNILAWSTLSISDRRSFLERLMEIPFDGLVIDEIQNGKGGVNEDSASARAKALRALSCGLKGLKRVFAASATPWENRPEEMAATCAIIRPDLFPDPKRFLTSGLKEVPRVLREVMDANVLDIAFRDIRDATRVTPKPWEELFNAVPVTMGSTQRKLYEKLLSDSSEEKIAAKKMRELLQMTVHPPLLFGQKIWTPEEQRELLNWQHNAKLKWLKRQIDTRIDKQKIVVGTGISVSGITRPMKDPTLPWIGNYLRDWYGEEAVIVIDGEVAIGKERDREINAWRSSPKARILLVSMTAVPDSINLSVRPTKGVESVFITALQLDWKPWYQFLNRFTRDSAGPAVEFQVPILEDTIDDSLLRLLQEKWRIQQLFRAKVPLTNEEWATLKADESGGAIREMLRTPTEQVHEIYSRARGLGEQGLQSLFNEPSGLHSKGQAFAEAFAKIQESKLSGSIARFMGKTLKAYIDSKWAPELFLDAGCGSLMLARTIDHPIYGVDLNESMVAIARRDFPELARNVHVGRLSELAPEWTGRFRLTTCSLVLDWSTMAMNAASVPERLTILRELIRVTHPQGQLWITLPHHALDEALFLKWRAMFEANGFSIAAGNNGLIESADGPKENQHRFWSFLVSPNGHKLDKVTPSDLLFLFETGRGKTKSGRGRDNNEMRKPGASFRHENFNIKSVGRNERTLTDEVAAAETLIGEAVRLKELARGGYDPGFSVKLTAHHLKDIQSNWKLLTKLQRLGII